MRSFSSRHRSCNPSSQFCPTNTFCNEATTCQPHLTFRHKSIKWRRNKNSSDIVIIPLTTYQIPDRQSSHRCLNNRVLLSKTNRFSATIIMVYMGLCIHRLNHFSNNQYWWIIRLRPRSQAWEIRWLWTLSVSLELPFKTWHQKLSIVSQLQGRREGRTWYKKLSLKIS